MRPIVYLDDSIIEVEQLITAEALSWPEVKRGVKGGACLRTSATRSS